MAMGRGSSRMMVFLAFLLICWSNDAGASMTHIVGDKKGWGFSVSYQDWTNARPFAAGDTLVFNYAPRRHNVVPVNDTQYHSCKATEGANSQAMSTGKDKIMLKMGANYFICSFPGHCAAGMKLLVNAN